MTFIRLILLGALIWPCFEPSAFCAEADPYARWESEIQAFEKADREKPPPKDAFLFVGSSSIRLWTTLEKDFPGRPIIQRGFGGSQMADSVHFADRIVRPYAPRMVLVYAGDNDIAAKKTPARVLEDFKRLVGKIRETQPKARVAFIAIKPSLARWALIDQIRTANELVKKYCQTEENLEFIDIFTPMLGDDGRPRPEFFVKDGLHMTATGYALWTRVIGPHLH